MGVTAVLDKVELITCGGGLLPDEAAGTGVLEEGAGMGVLVVTAELEDGGCKDIVKNN